MKSDDWWVIANIFMFLCFIICAICCAVVNYCEYNKTKIIKNPYIIYNDFSIKKMGNEGIYGIIDEENLERYLNYNKQN